MTLHRSLPFVCLRANRYLRAFDNRIDFLGGYIVGVTPVPIPNTEVKPYGADGTAWETVWESRTLPGINSKNPLASVGGFFGLMGLQTSSGTCRNITATNVCRFRPPHCKPGDNRVPCRRILGTKPT